MKAKRIIVLILIFFLLCTYTEAYAIENEDVTDEQTDEIDTPDTPVIPDIPEEPTSPNEPDAPNVPEEPNTPDESDEQEIPDISEIIPVTDIEIGEYEEEIEKDATTTISATVLPLDATEQTLTYKSSNDAVATISSNGTVKGISTGKATITITAGEVTKTITISVIVKEKSISLNQTYVVLKPDDTFPLQATVLPEDSTYRSVTFKSLNEDIATVSANGVITAKSYGTGTITVSSEHIIVAVTVIVNRNTNTIELATEKDIPLEKDDTSYPLFVLASEYPYLESDMLKYYYENVCRLIVQGDGYQLIIDGENIKNYNNSLKTDINLHTTSQGILFNLNDGKSLCGEVTLLLNNTPKHLYLYNESKKSYQEIRTKEDHVWKLNTAGCYLFTNENLNSKDVIWWIILSAGCVAICLLIVYIIVKKKYWFW